MARRRRLLHRLHHDDSGTAITEAALTLVPLVFFLLLPPAILRIWMNEQNVRAEAHRDVFDKTTTIILIPEAHRTTSGHFDQVTEAERRHVFPDFPPPVSRLNLPPVLPYIGVNEPSSDVEPTVGPQTVQIFPDGFPNQYVEGWKYATFEYAGGWFAGDIEMMRYGAVIRSPWTWLGWPFIPTQDAYWEPKQIQGWYDGNGVDSVWALGPYFGGSDPIKTLLKLVD